MTIVIWELSNNLQAGYCWASAGSGPSEGGLWPAALALAAIVLLLWGRTGTSKGVLS